MTAEDREIARTAPDWWTGADVSQQTELPLVERLRKVSCYTRAFSFSGPHNRTANAIDEAIAMLEAERGRADAAERDAASKQARIDELMLEYCPDEMTPEQLAEWGKHQRPIGSGP